MSVMVDLQVVPDEEDFVPDGYEQPETDDPGDLPGHDDPGAVDQAPDDVED